MYIACSFTVYNKIYGETVAKDRTIIIKFDKGILRLHDGTIQVTVCIWCT